LYSHVKRSSGKNNAPHNPRNLKLALPLIANKTHKTEDIANESTNWPQTVPQIEEKNKGKIYIENELTEEGI